MKPRQSHNSQRGQIMMGFYIAVIAMMSIGMIVMIYVTNSRNTSAHRQYKDLALEVAKAGFEDALNYYQSQPNGVFLSPSSAPPDQFNHCSTCTAAQYLWPDWPDDAFRPKVGDTGLYVPVSTYAGTQCAAAIIRDVQMHLTRTAVTGSELANSMVWGRYVIKRQVVRNWSPGPNTANAVTDTEACHDITVERNFSTAATLGSGNYWSITSRGYLYLGNSQGNDITVAAATTYNTLTSSPCATYPPCNAVNAPPMLLASAKVYGELYRANFSAPQAAIFVSKGSNIWGDSSNSIINGTTADAWAAPDATTPIGGPPLELGGTTGGNCGYAPTVATVFPGLNLAALQIMATTVTASTAGFPDQTSPNYTAEVSQVSFYFVTNASSPATTFTFTPALNNRFSGTGVAFFNGSLSITAGTVATWAGVVFVNGNVYMNAPANIFGELICTGKVYMAGASGGLEKAEVDYSQAAVQSAEQLLQGFKVAKPSVVVSYN
jgi:hypothetical protein